jgi:anti-anti-sigma factor
VRVSFDDDGSIVLRIVGEIDLATVSVLRDALNSVPPTDAARVVLDVSGIDFIGAAGVRVFLEARQRLAHARRDLVLRGPSPMLMRVLEAIEVDREFHIEQRPGAPTRMGDPGGEDRQPRPRRGDRETDGDLAGA